MRSMFCLFRMSTPRKRDLSNMVYATDEERAASIEKAEKLEASLGPDYPILVRSMLPSHVSGGFWLVSFNLLWFYIPAFILSYQSMFILQLLFMWYNCVNIFALHCRCIELKFCHC